MKNLKTTSIRKTVSAWVNNPFEKQIIQKRKGNKALLLKKGQ